MRRRPPTTALPWLQRFIEEQGNSLNKVDMELATLTDGTWRSIAQQLKVS
jgi:hypothetical protein